MFNKKNKKNLIADKIFQLIDRRPASDNLMIGKTNLINREQWLKKTLLKIPKGKHILDAGAGELQYKKFCKHLRYTSQDFAQYDGSGDKKGLQTEKWDNSRIDIVSDITNIPVKDNSFDAIMCIEVFEHLPDPVAAFNELYRVLKPKGYLIITSPFASITHFSPYHFSTGFNRYFYEHHSKKLGLTILDLQANGNYFQYLAQELRRIYFIVEEYTDQHHDQELNKKVTEIIMTLDHYDKHSKSSEELLCYGYHYFSQKNLHR